uniref:Uncharacterized protein n=1 Tax=Branchiostoma floridae TaxID=7739 RepID=C3YHS3_BRAFL|eukprot:XP_002604049.1 hypothetical protein BRAFLDRAFT_71661 [Branchiostoma floridae]
MALKITCGFRRVGARESKLLGLTEEEKQTRRFGQANLEEQYRTYTDIFVGEKENELNFKDFCDSVKHIGKVLNTWTQNRRDEKAKFLEYFSVDKWQKLSAAAKAKHAAVGPCKECQREHGAFWELYNKQIKSANVRCVLSPISTPLNVSKLGQNQKIDQSSKRKLYREFKADVEAAQRLNNKDVEVAYATDESLRSRRKRRLAEEFESKDEAEQRTKKRKLLEELGQRKPRNKLGNFENWATFDGERLKQEVDSYEDGENVNWTELARKYEIKTPDGKVPPNAGQLLKLWLKKQHIDTERFNKLSSAVIRRARIKLNRGTGVTLPRQRTERQISKQLCVMINDGEIPIGEFVVARKYKKFFLNRQTNKIETKVVTTEGRKHSLLTIRKKLLTAQQPFLRDAADYNSMTEDQLKQRLVDLGEDVPSDKASMIDRLSSIERTRHLMYWEDGATLANRGYIAYMVATVYDSAIYLTDTEYYEKFKVRLSVQSKVEQPELYLIARSGSSDAEQLLYTQTRRDDLPSLQIQVQAPDGRQYKDILRFFKGDNPARQFEVGEQKGGFHPCLCPIDIRCVHRFSACSRTDEPAPTIEDRRQFLLEGPVTSRKASSMEPEPFGQLTKEEMKDEVTSRGSVSYAEAENMSKKDVQQEMKGMLHGMKRAPTLLLPDLTQTTAQLNIQQLEAPASESMHDLFNHSKNILNELPAHVPKEVKETIQRVKDIILGGKEIVRASDMRYAIIMLNKELEKQQKASNEVKQLLYTLAEMQRLCYLAADNRNMVNIYRMSNIMFHHHVMLKEVFPGNPKVLTHRKLWGMYIHSLRDHTPVIYRIAAISSLMAENEERQFANFKRVTKSSACYGTEGHVITNYMIRSHCSEKVGASENRGCVENKISQVAKLLPQERTKIPVALLKKYPREAQAWCERVCDFFHRGYGIHWHVEGEHVILHDAPSQDPPFHPAGPTMRHFRSTSIKQMHNLLRDDFQQCIEEEIPMPVSTLWLYNGQTLVKKVKTPFLDTGHDFSQHVPYMSETVQETEDEEEREEMPVEQDPACDEPEEEEEVVIRMDPLDPDPELDEFEDGGSGTHNDITMFSLTTTASDPYREPGMQAAASHVHVWTPGQAPCSSRAGKKGESNGSSFLATPPRTPVQEAGPTRSTIDAHRNEPKWQTKLGSALAVVIEDAETIQRVDSLKARLKMEPRNKFIKAEYDNCVAVVSTRLSKTLHEERKNFMTWEKSFVTENGRLPTAEDVNESAQASARQKRIRYAEHLLRSFGVNLHMM